MWEPEEIIRNGTRGHHRSIIDINNENNGLHRQIEFSHQATDLIENESDLDFSDSRISSTSLVQALIQKLPENGWLEEQKISPQLGFIAEYDSSINKPRTEFAGDKQVRLREKVSEYKPQNVFKIRKETEVTKYINSEEVPPAIKKYGPLPTTRLTITDDATLKRLNAYRPSEKVEPFIPIKERIKSIDPYPLKKKKTTVKAVKDRDSLHAIIQHRFDEHGPYIARKSTRPVSVSSIDGNKASVATPADVQKYSEFRQKSMLKERNITSRCNQ